MPLQIALSDTTTVDTFNYRNLYPGAAMHTLGEALDTEGNPFRAVFKQPVLSYRADDLIKQFGLPPPNHVKIDVDGTELAVLRGMEETLGKPSVASIPLEVNEGRGHKDEILDFLAKKGFETHAKHGENYIFLRKS